MEELVMIPQLTTLRTMTQYSLARLRVLCATRTLCSALLVSSLLVLAVIGISRAWRARTSTEEPPLAEASFSVSPLAELIPQHTAVREPQEATTVTSAPPVTLSMATDRVPVTQSAETRDPVTATTAGGEHAQPACRQQVNTMPQAV